MEFAQKQMTKLALAGVLLGMCGWFGHILSLHDDDARFTFSPHFQVLNAPLEFAWEHASPKYLNMAEVELPHRRARPRRRHWWGACRQRGCQRLPWQWWSVRSRARGRTGK